MKNTAQTSYQKLAAFIALLLTGALLFGGAVLPAHADSLDDRLEEAQNKRKASDANIENLTNELAETDQKLAQAYIALQVVLDKLPVAEAALAVAQKEFDTAQREAETLASKLQDAQDEKVALEGQIEDNDTAMTAARSGVVEMGRQAARGELDMSGLGLIVGAQSSDDFIERYNMNNTALRTQGTSLNRLRQTQAVSRNAQVRLEAVNTAIADLKKQADEKLADAAVKKERAESAKAEVEGLIVEQQQATAIIESRKEQARQDLMAEEEFNASMSDEIREINGLKKEQREKAAADEKRRQDEERKKKEAEDANKKPSRPGSGGGTGPTTPPAPPSTGGGGGSTGGGNSNGWFVWPTNYRVVTSSYGMRLHPILGYYRLHAGTDMRSYCNTPIYAGRDGTVQWAKWKNGFGNQVLLNHGTVSGSNVMSSYNHLTRFSVGNGQQVKAGQIVGYSGNTGLSGACHLHFEVYVNGSTIDPMTKMK